MFNEVIGVNPLEAIAVERPGTNIQVVADIGTHPGGRNVEVHGIGHVLVAAAEVKNGAGCNAYSWRNLGNAHQPTSSGMVTAMPRNMTMLKPISQHWRSDRFAANRQP